MTSYLAAARAVGSEIAARHADDVDARARFPHEAIAALKERKLLGLLVPAPAGGAGATIGDVVAICHALGQSCASTAMIYAMHQIQVACIVRHGANQPWHAAFLRHLAAEQLLLASATSEAGVGGDVRTSICAVKTEDGHFSLAKEATVISYGAQADGILVTARRTPQAPPTDQVIVVVPKAGCVLDHRTGWDTLGMRGTCSDGYDLKCQGDPAQIIPAPYAEVSAQTMLPTSHLVWSAVWLGIATDAVARARAFVRLEARKKFGSAPIGARRFVEARESLQSMKQMLSGSLRRYETALAEPDKLASLSFAFDMNGLKTNISQMAVQTIQHAMMVCGLAGYRNDSPFSLGRHLRDVHSAVLMVNNDRIFANMANLMPGLSDELDLPA
jgi:acyl-CoA dehydrogenase